MRPAGILLLLSALCAPVHLVTAQGQGTVLLVRVGDETDGAFVRGAMILLPALGLGARTDSLGEARVAGIPAGAHTVQVRRLGYAPMHLEAEFSGRDSTEIVFMLRPIPRELTGVSVEEARVPYTLREFEARRRRHVGGHFITADEITRYGTRSLDALFTRFVPGVDAVPEPEFRMKVYSRRGANSISGGKCQIPVYVDGVRLWDGDAGLLPLEWIGGIEFHPPGFVPVQYREPARRELDSRGMGIGPYRGGSAACGVLLIWSKS